MDENIKHTEYKMIKVASTKQKKEDFFHVNNDVLYKE